MCRKESARNYLVITFGISELNKKNCGLVYLGLRDVWCFNYSWKFSMKLLLLINYLIYCVVFGLSIDFIILLCVIKIYVREKHMKNNVKMKNDMPAWHKYKSTTRSCQIDYSADCFTKVKTQIVVRSQDYCPLFICHFRFRDIIWKIKTK